MCHPISMQPPPPSQRCSPSKLPIGGVENGVVFE